MKLHFAVRRFGFASLFLGAAGACASAAEPAAFVRSFQAPNGETYYAVSLTADGPALPAAAHHHVILVDTSASQVGDYRRQALEVLDSLLASLPAVDRVSVMAVDVGVAPLTPGFQTPAEARASAKAALQQRFPAGATNLVAGLRAAQSQFPADQDASIIYLGDGMSTAHLVATSDLTQLIDELRARQIPVHSLAVGPNQDVKLLGVLAQQTGGRVFIDNWRNDEQRSAAVVGQELARAVDQPVWFPAQLQTDAAILPARPLPLRGDRATVLIGRGEFVGKTVTLAGPDGEQTTWQLPEAQSANGNTFLYNLYGHAEATPALGAGLAGDEVLAFAQTAYEDHIAAMEAAGYEALRAGDFRKAEEIGFAIRNIDPENVRAVGMINAAAGKQQPVALLDDAQPAPLEQRTAPATDQGLIELARQRQDALAQKLQGQLDATKSAANQVLRVDPQQSLGMLERMRNVIKAAADISPESRDQMLRELNTFEQYVQREANLRSQQLQQLALQERINDSQRQLIEHTDLLDARMEQLVDRVRALMIDFREGDDNAAEEAEMVGGLIVNLRPGNPLGMAAVTISEAAGQLRKAHRMRALRADRLLETLYQVELAHVPFPDEPPVRYPPAEVWQALTERRKKWASVDLKQNNPNEQRIYDALNKQVDIEFIDTELKQALDYLADRYQIPVIPDETRMTEFGVGLDTQINLVISGITLRSALKLMLEPHSLTYIVEDEVMKITTADYANQVLQTRVYPVADLVIPIQPLPPSIGGGGFGGGQQGGGFGGQGGGGGGGFNVNVGGGGGAGGGGFGGGGGGFFSVPPEQPKARTAPQFNNDAINQLKKKP